jgi:hypothetical protein
MAERPQLFRCLVSNTSACHVDALPAGGFGKQDREPAASRQQADRLGKTRALLPPSCQKA